MRVLGIVEWVSASKGGNPIAGVKPLLEITEVKWREVDPTEFPTQGQVFWSQARDAKKDQLILFRAEDNSHPKYQYKVAEHQEALEVIDFRKVGSPERVRRAFLAGLQLPGFVPGRVLLWCDGDYLIGPVRLLVNPKGMLSFEHPHRDRIPAYSRSLLDIREIPRDGTRRFILASSSPGAPSAHVDWDEDKLVVRRAITWVANRAKEHGIDHELTHRRIEEAAESLTKDGTSAELKLVQYRLNRALEIVAEKRRAEELAQSVVETLRIHPVIAQELERLREEIKISTRTEIREAMRIEIETLEAAKRERKQIEADTKAAREQLVNIRAQVDAQVQEVDAEVAKRVNEVLKKPSSLLAEVAILQAMFRGPSGLSPRSESSQVTTDQLSVAWVQATRVITEFKELRKSLVACFKAIGVSPQIASRIHAALSAKLMPVLAGPRALAALDAYARVASGGRIFRIHITPSLLEPSDLFGKVDFVRGRFLPHPDGLIDILETARRATGLALVILEGINRAPTESYLLPLLQCALGKAGLQLFHPAVVAADDPYHHTAELQWPQNVLISATVVEGPTTLPISRDLWSTAVLIETDGDAQEPSPAALPETEELDLKGDLMKPSEPLSNFEDGVFDALPEYRSFRDMSGRFLSALLPFESDHYKDKLEGALIESLLLPLIASLDNEEDRDEALQRLVKVLGPTGIDLSKLNRWVRRIRWKIA